MIDVNTSAMTKYYYAGSERVAMKAGTNNPTWLLGDHLGSTSVAANNDGSLLARQGYKAWGEQRFPTGASPLPTIFRYTGQREASSLGLYYYGARWYDASLGRFISSDTVIPEESQGVQAWDRYGGMNNNPVRYSDPTGHIIITDGPDNDKFNKWLADQYKKEKISEEVREPSLPFESDTTSQDNNSCNSCNQGELIAAVSLLVVADAVIVGIPTVILFFVATPAGAALYLEVMEIVLIPVNIIAVYMAYDSNCIAGFSPGS